MGVQGLWDLLAPVGRRVSVETLSGKKLAIDASIWMVQFMKAMRDEKGEMVRNAHLLGFFRRICKLLYLRTKPVFVFDGGTPALKRRTVIARRRQRENAQAKIRKTAEKLLLNHLKVMRLKELAKELEEQRKKQGSDAKGKKVLAGETDTQRSNLEKDNFGPENFDRENFDEMLAASIAAEEGQWLNSNASTSAATTAVGGPIEDEENDEEMILPEMNGEIDPSILAALPPSMQLDLLMRGKSMAGSTNNPLELKKPVGNENEKCELNAKGKEILLDQTDMEMDDKTEDSYNQEKLDEMLAASLMADEDGSFTTKASKSAATHPSGEDDEDEYEEIILPAMHGGVDPAVLATLPPSMQLDLLVQMRERLMAENRQKYQKVKKAPEKFSELQIQSYLKTVAFRREINQLQKAASGKGVDGVQTSRIASEANREFIFSSSFTGDKQSLTSAEVHRHGEKQEQALRGHPASASVNIAALIGSNTFTGLVQDEPPRVFDDNVETYTDERGRTRISRLRAMGLRMTRDLQRNLDLMKEMEKENRDAIKAPSSRSELNNNNIAGPECHPSGKQHEKGLHCGDGDSASLDERNVQSKCNYETSIQVSFEVDGEIQCLDSDDDMFACLLAGRPANVSSADKSTSRRQSSNSCSDSDWEEGIVELNGNCSSNDVELGPKPSLEESNISDGSEVEWEEGGCDAHENSLVPDQSRKHVSRGYLEEEADLQEAIKRSLEDIANGDDAISEHKQLNVCRAVGLFDQEDSRSGKDASKSNKSDTDIVGVEKLDATGKANISRTFSSPGAQLKASEPPSRDNLLTNEPHERHLGSNFSRSSQDWNKDGKLDSEMPSVESFAPKGANEMNLIVEQSASTFVEDRWLFTSTKTCSGDAFHISKAASSDLPNVVVADDEKNDVEAEPSIMVNEEKIVLDAPPSSQSVEITDPSISFVQQSTKDSVTGIDYGEKLSWEKAPHDQLSEKNNRTGNSALRDNQNVQVNFSEGRLEEEILILGQESVNLEDEQRKLERNAESVSSEMFAECQELLQMFGIPYIIAPMEAEAQCAYMEVANLVDGVVTDDSDVFLFGACSVYKNIFDDRKYVETYLMKDIEKELGLTTEKLIRMALLLGSDYTEGVSGIGIVNAIEVVNAFPEEDGLHKFREWVESPDPTILGKLDEEKGINTREKASKVDDNFNGANSNVEAVPSSDQNCLKANENRHSASQNEDIKRIFMDKHRNVSKNWHIPSSFPSGAVIAAYSSPQVDRSTDSFTWAKPDLHVLRKLCWEKFGWNIQKTDELLLPVLKEYDKRETQLRIEAFYTFNERFAKIRSKRIKKAVKGITGNQTSDLVGDPVEKVSKKRKRRMSPGKSNGNESGKSKTAEETGPDDKSDTLERSSTKRSRKRTAGEPAPHDVQSPERRRQEGRMHTKKGSHGNGRARKSGMRQRTGQGKTKEGLHLEQSDSSSSDGGDIDHEVPMVNSEGIQEARRSARSRKAVSYAENDVETDDVEDSEDRNGEERSHGKSTEQGLHWDQGSCGDAITGLDGEQQQKAKDPLVEGSSPDYPERGGGFCADDGEVGVPGETNDSKDYRKMGGGFCMDESEGGEDQDAACNSTAAPVRETADSPSLCGFAEETEHGGGSVHSVSVHSVSSMKGNKNEIVDGGKNHIPVTEQNMNRTSAHNRDPSEVNGSQSQLDGTKINTGSSRVGLHAMPFLKRKRRKS